MQTLKIETAKNGKLYAEIPADSVAEGDMLTDTVEATGIPASDIWTDTGRRNGYGRPIMQRVKQYRVVGLGKRYNGSYRVDAEDARSMSLPADAREHEGAVFVRRGVVQRAYLESVE